MAEYHDREHYIPIRRSELIEALATDKGLTEEQSDAFRQYCNLINATFHFQYHDTLEQLKDEYAPFDPDRVTVPLKEISEDVRDRRRDQLFEKFNWLMERANYKRLTHDELMKATEAASDWGINLDIDFTLFEHLEVYIRGDKKGIRPKRHWLMFWKEEEVEVPLYERVVIILKLQKHKRLDRSANLKSVYFKLFKEIPKDDIEMLLPGGRLKMPKFAIGKLGASLVGAIGYVSWKLSGSVTALITALTTFSYTAIVTLFGPVSLIAGYGYKQWAGYQAAKQSYTMQLTQSLYYLNLDSNAGVLFHVLDEAEEQECREAILAYYYLWRYAGENGWTEKDLDDYVELDLERLANLKVDFEIGDALEKLETLELIEKNGDRYKAVPIDKALEKLDYRWDNYFTYNK